MRYNANINNPAPNYDHPKTVDEMNSELKWFDEQHAAAIAKFGSYLRIA